MYAQIIVPLDGSDFAARALEPAVHLAKASDAPLTVVSYAAGRIELPTLQAIVEKQVEAVMDRGIDPQAVTVRVTTAGRPGPEIVEEVAKAPGSLICMSSLGRPRTGAVFGSVAETVLREVTIPLVLVGPNAEARRFDFDRPLVVCVDGSRTSEAILPIVASWGIVYGVDVRVVSVQPPVGEAPLPEGEVAIDTAYLRRIASKLADEIGRTVDFDVLHGDDVVDAVVDHCNTAGASMIAASTHGRTGLRRVVVGSVMAGLVHRARQPVLAYRPLQLLR